MRLTIMSIVGIARGSAIAFFIPLIGLLDLNPATASWQSESGGSKLAAVLARTIAAYVPTMLVCWAGGRVS